MTGHETFCTGAARPFSLSLLQLLNPPRVHAFVPPCVARLARLNNNQQQHQQQQQVQSSWPCHHSSRRWALNCEEDRLQLRTIITTTPAKTTMQLQLLCPQHRPRIRRKSDLQGPRGESPATTTHSKPPAQSRLTSLRRMRQRYAHPHEHCVPCIMGRRHCPSTRAQWVWRGSCY